MLDNGKRKGSAMNIEIAQRLYELRRKHGFSQESLAAALGLSRQAISKWERSESAPDMGNLIALADLYGMTIDELIRPAAKDGPDSYAEASSETGEVAVTVETAEGAEAPEAAEMVALAEVSEATESIEVAEAIEDAEGNAACAEAAEAVQEETEAVQELQPQPQPSPAPAGAAQGQQPASPGQEDVKQVYAHGHLYTKPAGAAAPPQCALRRFPYPLLVVVVFLLLALVFGMWEYIWLFLTIPFYYWIARVIERDPIFLERHGYTPPAADADAQHDYASVYGVHGKGVQ